MNAKTTKCESQDDKSGRHVHCVPFRPTSRTSCFPTACGQKTRRNLFSRCFSLKLVGHHSSDFSDRSPDFGLNPASSGENSRRKLQNVVSDSRPDFRRPGSISTRTMLARTRKLPSRIPSVHRLATVKTIDPTPDGLGSQTANVLQYKRGWSFR